MENKIVNARELFLICALRKSVFVQAINLSSYNWTFKHNAFVQKKMEEMNLKLGDKGYHQELKNAREEAKKIVSVEESKERMFCIYIKEGSANYTLCDVDNLIPWYDLNSGSNDRLDWVYRDSFELLIGMNPKEEFFIKSYAGF